MAGPQAVRPKTNEILKGISIDPGKTTGYTYFELRSKESLEYHPFQSYDDVDDLWRRLKDLQPRYIIIEDFEFRQKSRAGLILFPVQMIGVARLYSLIAPPPCSIYVQKAAQGKSYYKDPILKKNGLYKRGIPHAMDASRHLLHWITFGAGYEHNSSAGQISDFAKMIGV